eukprot:2715075-Amphidinium_carterae.1
MASTCYRHQNNNHIAEKFHPPSRATTSQIRHQARRRHSRAGHQKLQIYKSLEDHNIIYNMESVKRKTTPIYDGDFIEHDLASGQTKIIDLRSGKKETGRTTQGEKNLQSDSSTVTTKACSKDIQKVGRRSDLRSGGPRPRPNL